MTVVDYRNPQTKQPAAFVSVGRLDPENIEIRVMSTGLSSTILPWTAIVAATGGVMGFIWFFAVDEFRWASAILACFGSFSAYVGHQRWTDRRSAHRWIVSFHGLSMQRVSPAGLLKRQFISRADIREVKCFHERSLGGKEYLAIGLRRGVFPSIHYFHGLTKAELYAVATAVHDGLRL